MQTRLRSASPKTEQQLQSKQDEVKRLNEDNKELQGRCSELAAKIDELRDIIERKDQEIALLNSNKTCLKELSETSMQDVARLDAQFEAGETNLPVKLQQQPKDTVMQKSDVCLVSSPKSQLTKNVDVKQLSEVIKLIKLLLQQKQICHGNAEKMARVLFEDGDYEPDKHISIIDLK